jgi:hypothetical protein
MNCSRKTNALPEDSRQGATNQGDEHANANHNDESDTRQARCPTCGARGEIEAAPDARRQCTDCGDAHRVERLWATAELTDAIMKAGTYAVQWRDNVCRVLDLDGPEMVARINTMDGVAVMTEEGVAEHYALFETLEAQDLTVRDARAHRLRTQIPNDATIECPECDGTGGGMSFGVGSIGDETPPERYAPCEPCNDTGEIPFWEHIDGLGWDEALKVAREHGLIEEGTS